VCSSPRLHAIVFIGQWFNWFKVQIVHFGCLTIQNVTESVKTGLIAHDSKFDFITQTQSLMNVLSNNNHRQPE